MVICPSIVKLKTRKRNTEIIGIEQLSPFGIKRIQGMVHNFIDHNGFTGKQSRGVKNGHRELLQATIGMLSMRMKPASKQQRFIEEYLIDSNATQAHLIHMLLVEDETGHVAILRRWTIPRIVISRQQPPFSKGWLLRSANRGQ